MATPSTNAPIPAAASGGGPALQINHGPRVILLVDDDFEVRGLCRMIIEQAGYTVLDAALGSEAVRLCKEHSGPIDLLITDIVMPEMDGGDLAMAVHSIRPNMPILYLSGYDYAVMELPADAFGAYLQKPIAPAVLLGKIRELLK